MLARGPRGSGDTETHNLLEAQEAPSADAALFDAEQRRQLLYWAAEQVRGEFSELTWRAFWQAGVEGRPAGEVAADLGTTVGTVYHCKSRVMVRLRKKIDEVLGQE
jgi:RNA polymerase sigma-70 factor (ECF subfamily)